MKLFIKTSSVLLLIAAIFLSSCASILNGKYQKVYIESSKSDTVLVNGEVPEMKDGRYKIRRDYTPKQITIKSEKYHDQNITIFSYKTSPLYFFSVVPFGILFYPMLYDVGNRAKDYDKVILTKDERILDLSAKNKDLKQVEVNKVDINVSKENIKERNFPSYKNYVRREDKKKVKESSVEDDINVGNTQISYLLNEALANKGYIDTSGRVLHKNYANSVKLNATIDGITIHKVSAYNSYSNKGFIFLDLNVKWEILDYYNNTIYDMETMTRSGQFSYTSSETFSSSIHSSIKDAMEVGLIKLMSKKEVAEFLEDKSDVEPENKFNVLSLAKPARHVSGLAEAIKSSVTIKTKEGFGSGFFVSNDGYIVTNYHVVRDSSDLTVVLNDKSEHKARVERVSMSHDLALIKIEGKSFTPFNLATTKDVPIASDVYAVGTPTSQDLSQTISRGIISGLRDNGSTKLIQTDASINGGNSGGPLVLKNGQVLGVVSSKIRGVGIEGMAFGIPAYEIFDQLKIEYK